MIPQKPLEVLIDPKTMTLDDVELFTTTVVGEGLQEQFEYLHLVRQFLIEHTNWNRHEVGKITFDEIKTVMGQLRGAMQSRAVPLVTLPDSKPLPAAESAGPTGATA